MKATIYTLIIVSALAIIAYWVYTSEHPIKFTPTGDFDTDDQKLYSLIRADLQAWTLKQNGDKLAWFDDEVKDAYSTNLVDGHVSKTGAYVGTLLRLYPNHPKKDYYSALLANLTNRYK